MPARVRVIAIKMLGVRNNVTLRERKAKVGKRTRQVKEEEVEEKEEEEEKKQEKMSCVAVIHKYLSLRCNSIKKSAAEGTLYGTRARGEWDLFIHIQEY